MVLNKFIISLNSDNNNKTFKNNNVMKNLNTKAGRNAQRDFQFSNLIADGYAKTEFLDLVIFTKDDNARNRFYYTIFTGTAGKPSHQFYCTNSDHRTKSIDAVKQSAEFRAKRKAEAANAPKVLTGAAAAAAAIRAELKTVFSGVKFSVTSESFSGGDAVRISWTDGPTDAQVSKITNKYSAGRFNGMEDIYEYNENKNGLPTAKFITTSRKFSEGFEATIKNLIAAKYPNDTDYQIERETYQIINRTALPAGFVVAGLEFRESSNAGGKYLPSGFYVKFEGVAPVQSESLSKVAANVAKKETAQALEVAPGSVQIVDYSEKAFAVIGDTKTIKENLKTLGGRFNYNLSCGPGWIFSKKSLAAVTEFLSASAEPETDETSPEANAENFASDPAPEVIAAAMIEAKAEAEKNAAGTLADEVQKTVEFLAETDLKLYGEIMSGTKEAAKVQNITLFDAVPEFETLDEITAAAEGGKVISLLNLSNLVNSDRKKYNA